MKPAAQKKPPLPKSPRMGATNVNCERVGNKSPLKVVNIINKNGKRTSRLVEVISKKDVERLKSNSPVNNLSTINNNSSNTQKSGEQISSMLGAYKNSGIRLRSGSPGSRGNCEEIVKEIMNSPNPK